MKPVELLGLLIEFRHFWSQNLAKFLEGDVVIFKAHLRQWAWNWVESFAETKTNDWSETNWKIVPHASRWANCMAKSAREWIFENWALIYINERGRGGHPGEPVGVPRGLPLSLTFKLGMTSIFDVFAYLSQQSTRFSWDGKYAQKEIVESETSNSISKRWKWNVTLVVNKIKFTTTLQSWFSRKHI